MKNQIIYVGGEEAELVKAADVIIGDAERTAKEQESQTGLHSPMLFFGTAERAEIVRQVDKMKEDYRASRNLNEMPILIPYDLLPIERKELSASGKFYGMVSDYSSGTRAAFHPYKAGRDRHEPTHFDLEGLVVQRACIKAFNDDIFHYSGGHYRKLTEHDALVLIRKCIESELRIAGNANQLNNILSLLRTDAQIMDIPLEQADLNIICVGNGLLDLDTLCMTAPTPNFFFTSRIEADWRGSQPCPLFDRFLGQVTGGNPVLTTRIWQAIGYALVPDNRAKRFIVMQGVGDSGKSVLGNLLSSFFDHSAVSSVDIFKLKDRFTTAELAGKRLNISMDLPAGNISEQAVGILKQITGGDEITIEEKYKKPRVEKINCTMLFGTNHTISLWMPDEAFARRMLLIPFQFRVPKEAQDPHLLERLEAEKSGILYHAVMAYKQLRSGGYIFAGDDQHTFYTQLEECRTRPNDGISEFVQRCCSFDPSAFTSTEMLFRAYLDFCTANRMCSAQDKTAFSRRLGTICAGKVERGKQRVSNIPLNGYQGIALIGGDKLC